MNPDFENKCLVCFQTGGNLNIFTTYNVCNDKEELYVEVIKNCFNIEIAQETGLSAMCPDCSTKLRRAYTFKNNIIEAIQNLVAFQEASTDEKEDPQIEYLDNQVENDYDINTILNPETGQITYTLDKIDQSVATTVNEQDTYQIDLENDVISKKGAGKNKKVIEEKQEIDLNVVKENLPNNFDKKEEEKPKRLKRARTVKKELKSKKTVEVINENENNAVNEVVKIKEKAKRQKKNNIEPPFTLEPGQTACKVCPTQFETTKSLSAHMNIHYPNYVCAECGQVFASERKMKMHGYQMHVEGPIVCKYCDKEFTNANTRNAHMWRVHTKTDPFKCGKCGERFKTYLKRLRHLQSVHGDKLEYPCELCDKKFAYAAYRTKHVRTVHQQARPHKCPRCAHSCARRRELLAHLASKHGEGELKYQCDVCAKKFYFKTALKFHLSLHDNRYACNQCDAKFPRISQLETHYKTHDPHDLAPENILPGLDSVSLQLEELSDYALLDSLWGFSEI